MSAAPGFERNGVPRLRNGFRLQHEPAQDAHVLLFPEGMIKLSMSAKEILERCDGERSVDDVIAALETAFPGADLTNDVLDFIGVATEKGWIDVN